MHIPSFKTLFPASQTAQQVSPPRAARMAVPPVLGSFSLCLMGYVRTYSDAPPAYMIFAERSSVSSFDEGQEWRYAHYDKICQVVDLNDVDIETVKARDAKEKNITRPNVDDCDINEDEGGVAARPGAFASDLDTALGEEGPGSSDDELVAMVQFGRYKG